MKTKTRRSPEVVPPPVSTIETFRDARGSDLTRLAYDEPTCFNGRVLIRRYRVTCEVIDEPKEVLIERLQKLWRECDNHHHWHPLQATARELGIELASNEFGKERKDRR